MIDQVNRIFINLTFDSAKCQSKTSLSGFQFSGNQAKFIFVYSISSIVLQRQVTKIIKSKPPHTFALLPHVQSPQLVPAKPIQ